VESVHCWPLGVLGPNHKATQPPTLERVFGGILDHARNLWKGKRAWRVRVKEEGSGSTAVLAFGECRGALPVMQCRCRRSGACLSGHLQARKGGAESEAYVSRGPRLHMLASRGTQI